MYIFCLNTSSTKKIPYNNNNNNLCCFQKYVTHISNMFNHTKLRNGSAGVCVDRNCLLLWVTTLSALIFCHREHNGWCEMSSSTHPNYVSLIHVSVVTMWREPSPADRSESSDLIILLNRGRREIIEIKMCAKSENSYLCVQIFVQKCKQIFMI